MPLPEVDVNRAAHHPLTAGLLGALVGLRWAPGTTWLGKLSNVAAGSLFAGYLGPVAAQLLGWPGPEAQSALGFGFGLFGLSLAGSVAQAIKETQLSELVKQWFGRKE